MRVARARAARVRNRGEIREDGVIPLINIVFLLLVFFLLAGHIAPAEPADISPPISANPPDNPAEPAVLYIQADGTTLHNDAIVSDLMAAITAIAAADGDAPVTIRADQAAPAAKVLAVADALRVARLAQSRLVVLQGR